MAKTWSRKESEGSISKKGMSIASNYRESIREQQASPNYRGDGNASPMTPLADRSLDSESSPASRPAKGSQVLARLSKNLSGLTKKIADEGVQEMLQLANKPKQEKAEESSEQEKKETQKTSVDHSRLQSSTGLYKAIKVGSGGLRSASEDSVDSAIATGPWPLADLKRDNTCLVMEDNTLIIKMPYRLERLFKQYLRKLEDDLQEH